MPNNRSPYHNYITKVDDKTICNYCHQSLSKNISRVRDHFEKSCNGLPDSLAILIRAGLVGTVNPDDHRVDDDMGETSDTTNMSTDQFPLTMTSGLGQTLSESSPVHSSRGTKPKCSVWNHFTAEENEEGGRKVTCNYCYMEFGTSIARNATRLRQHLTIRCKHVPDFVKNEFPEEETRPKAKRLSEPSSAKISQYLKVELHSEEEEEDAQKNTSDTSDSEIRTHVKKSVRKLEEENHLLNSKLKICQKQKEALLQINKYLDKSLSLMEKLNQVYVKVANTGEEPVVDKLNEQLLSNNDLVAEWKKKYNLIEFDDRMKKMCVRLPEPTPSGHRPQSSIWKYFKNIGEDAAGYKTIKCNFCTKMFRHKHLNATKCRTHIVENCEHCPEDIKEKENNWMEYHPQSKVDIWQYFSVTEDGYKTTVECVYCGTVYMGKNATKCRGHLVGKCERVPDDVRESIADKCDPSFINNSQLSIKSKMSKIWKHFDVDSEDGKYTCVCIYCRHTFSYKNATKCRKHLIDKCTGIPGDVRAEIAEETEESGRTWIQTKIPVWDYFETGVTDDGRESFTCRFCRTTYGYRNATKLRIHLLAKCPLITEETRKELRQHCRDSFYNRMQTKSTFKIEKKPKIKKARKNYTYKGERKGGRSLSFVWSHFREENDANGGVLKICKYCEQSYNYKNATKMRQHLALNCKSVPEDVKQMIGEMESKQSGETRPYRKRFAAMPGLHECCWPGCDLKFPKLSRLRNHQLSHTGNVQRIKCDWPGCEWSGRSKSDLKVHRCIHTGEKPYVCDWPGCEFKTAKPSSMWLHKRRHKELYRFACDWPGCERQFLTQWERQRHKNTHLGLKPFACQYCDKRYPIAYKLKVHQNKQHLNQMNQLRINANNNVLSPGRHLNDRLVIDI